MQRTKIICKFRAERFAALLPHIEWALINSVLDFAQITELIARECVEFDSVEIE